MKRKDAKTQLDSDSLVRDIRRLSVKNDAEDPETQASLLASTFDQCLFRCRSAKSTRQDLDNLGLWISCARGLIYEQHESIRAILLGGTKQSDLAAFIWDRLNSDRASISKKAESTAQSILQFVDLALCGDFQSGSASEPNLTSLTFNLMIRANAELCTRTTLVIYDVLFSVYDPLIIMGSIDNLERLYVQLVSDFPAKVDIPSRRSRVCMKILRSKGRQCGISFDSKVGQSVGVAIYPQKIKEWMDFACSPIVSALTSPIKQKRNSTSVYQLTELFALAPATLLPILADLLRPEIEVETALPAVLATLRAAKTQSLARVSNYEHEMQLEVGEILLGRDVAAHGGRLAPNEALQVYDRPCIVIPFELLCACATSNVEELQAAAVSLVVESRSTAAPFSQGDFHVLQAYLEASFSTTHPSGRGAMHSLFGKLLARLSAVTYAAERELRRTEIGAGQSAEEAAMDKPHTADKAPKSNHLRHLEESRSFILTVFKMVLAALRPGSPYHISIAALTFLELMFLSGVDPCFEGRSSGPIESTFGSFNKTHSFGLHLIDEKLVRMLLSCADSTYDDIQARALGLLHHFPAPLNGYHEEYRVNMDIVFKARKLLLSGRESESTAAGHLLRLYQHVYIRRLGWEPVLEQKVSAFRKLGSGADRLDIETRDLRLLADQLSFLEKQLLVAEQKGLFVAAKSSPVHGSLIALQKLLQDPHFWHPIPPINSLRRHLLHAQSLIDRTWSITRPILCAAAPEGSADENGDDTVGTEVGRALAAAQGIDDATAFEDLIRKSQVMLSYSWRGMKEAAALLGVLVSAPMAYAKTDVPTLWQLEEVQAVGERFINWMTLIRHRGAFSTVYPALSDAAAAIVRCEVWPSIQALPKNWLNEFVSGIVRRERRISTTRRSAGVGYAVLALITALSPRQDSSSPLDTTIHDLTRAADECYGSDDKATIAVHIHAINIIRVLVLDSRLAEAMSQYTDVLLGLVIHRFQSPTWSIRNAALMLFSALSSRAFPSRRANEDDIAMQLPANRFFEMYPTLHGALSENLRSLVGQQLYKASSGADVERAGSLYAVLFLFSRMQAIDHGESSPVDVSALRALIDPCLGSTDYKIREIASRAYTSLTTAGKASATVQRLLISPKGQESAADEWVEENRLHGVLLTCNRLLKVAVSQGLSMPSPAEAEGLRSRVTVASADVQEAYSELLQTLAVQSEEGVMQQSPAPTFDVLRRRLFDNNLDFQLRAQAANEMYEYNCNEYYSDAATDLAADWEATASLALTSGCIPLREAAVALLGQLTALRCHEDAEATASALALAARLVRVCGHEDQHVESRLAAARFLHAMSAGDHLFRSPSLPKSGVEGISPLWQRSLFKLHTAAIDLIQDDDEEVRLLAAGVIARTIGCATPLDSELEGSVSEDEASARLVRAAKSTVASSSVSTQRAWDWMSARYGVALEGNDSPWWTCWLVRLLLPFEAELDGTLKVSAALGSGVAHCGAGAQPEDDRELFAAERPNLYRDYEVDVRRAYEVLSSHGVTRPFVQRRSAIERRLCELCGSCSEKSEQAAKALTAFQDVRGRLLGVRLVCASHLASQDRFESQEVSAIRRQCEGVLDFSLNVMD